MAKKCLLFSLQEHTCIMYHFLIMCEVNPLILLLRGLRIIVMSMSVYLLFVSICWKLRSKRSWLGASLAALRYSFVDDVTFSVVYRAFISGKSVTAETGASVSATCYVKSVVKPQQTNHPDTYCGMVGLKNADCVIAHRLYQIHRSAMVCVLQF